MATKVNQTNKIKKRKEREIIITNNLNNNHNELFNCNVIILYYTLMFPTLLVNGYDIYGLEIFVNYFIFLFIFVLLELMEIYLMSYRLYVME